MIIKSNEIPVLIRGHWAARGLVGIWPMMPYEVGGNKVFDLSGNGNTGTLQADVAWISGKYGPAIQFVGNDYISLGTPANKPSLDVDYCTIVASVVINANLAQIGAIYSNSYNSGLYLAISNSEKLLLYHKSEGNAYDTYAPNITLTIGQRYQVVAVYDGITKDLYVDGVYREGEALGAKSGPLDWSTGIIRIGGNVNAADNTTIDYCFVYNRPLSASEIALLYREPFCMFERDPIELWVGSVGVGAPPAGIPIFRRRIEAA